MLPTSRHRIRMLTELAQYHPIVVEGMGYYDPRPPSTVAKQIVRQLQSHWSSKDASTNANGASNDGGGEGGARSSSPASINNKPKLLMTQGDPLADRGISAITPLVGEMLGIPRGLVVLDDHINPAHSANAPRDDVVLEMTYSQLLGVLSDGCGALANHSTHDGGGDGDGDDGAEISSSRDASIAARLERRIDERLAAKNRRRRELNKPPLRSYFKDFVMLQEVTKAACLAVCGDVTVAHTASDISDFSVTSFYEVGLDLGLLDAEKHYVPYGIVDELDFDKIDPR